MGMHKTTVCWCDNCGNPLKEGDGDRIRYTWNEYRWGARQTRAFAFEKKVLLCRVCSRNEQERVGAMNASQAETAKENEDA